MSKITIPTMDQMVWVLSKALALFHFLDRHDMALPLNPKRRQTAIVIVQVSNEFISIKTMIPADHHKPLKIPHIQLNAKAPQLNRPRVTGTFFFFAILCKTTYTNPQRPSEIPQSKEKGHPRLSEPHSQRH